MPVTKRQKEVLDFISAYVQDNGYSPSYEEMAEGLDLASVATVHKHVSALEAKAYLKRAPNMSRSLEVTPKWMQEQNLRNGSVANMPQRETRSMQVDSHGRLRTAEDRRDRSHVKVVHVSQCDTPRLFARVTNAPRPRSDQCRRTRRRPRVVHPSERAPQLP